MLDISSFSNTIDELGDENFCDQLIQGELTSIVDCYTMSLGPSALRSMPKLEKVVFLMCTEISDGAVQDSAALKCVDFHSLKKINYNGLKSDSLTTVILRWTGVCYLQNASLNSNAIFYVPSAYLKDYLQATNWSSYDSSQFRALEKYTVDGTIYGELDESKI